MKIATHKLNKYYDRQKKKGLTHDDIAKSLNVSTRYLYDLLNGTANPKDKTRDIEKVITTIKNDWNKEVE